MNPMIMRAERAPAVFATRYPVRYANWVHAEKNQMMAKTPPQIPITIAHARKRRVKLRVY
jgi:hypothetical protein